MLEFSSERPRPHHVNRLHGIVGWSPYYASILSLTLGIRCIQPGSRLYEPAIARLDSVCTPNRSFSPYRLTLYNTVSNCSPRASMRCLTFQWFVRYLLTATSAEHDFVSIWISSLAVPHTLN
jgi:hypothetical protein